MPVNPLRLRVKGIARYAVRLLSVATTVEHLVRDHPRLTAILNIKKKKKKNFRLRTTPLF